jgi:hypothetical protein
MNEARDIVSVEAEKGNPLAQLALDLIEKRIRGEELPPPEEYAKKQQEILESIIAKRMASQPESSTSSDASESESANVRVDSVQTAKPNMIDNDAANALLRSFASMAPVSRQPVEEVETSDEGTSASEEAASEETKES